MLFAASSTGLLLARDDATASSAAGDPPHPRRGAGALQSASRNLFKAFYVLCSMAPSTSDSLLIMRKNSRAVREVAQEKARTPAVGADSDADMDDGRMIDEELELDMWKLRELRRLKRDRDARMVFDKEEELTARRRGMTDAEIARDNMMLGIERVAAGTKKKDEGEEPSMRFMQKFYHRGGFFQDDESIKAQGELAQRDFQQATGYDRTTDVSLLPAVMQVKKFAMKGRTKCQNHTRYVLSDIFSVHASLTHHGMFFFFLLLFAVLLAFVCV